MLTVSSQTLAPEGIFSGGGRGPPRESLQEGSPRGGWPPDAGEVFKKFKKSNEEFTIVEILKGNFAIFSIFLNFIEFFAKILGKI